MCHPERMLLRFARSASQSREESLGLNQEIPRRNPSTSRTSCAPLKLRPGIVEGMLLRMTF